MARQRSTVKNLTQCQPIFQAFCFVHGLKDGDCYYPLDYVLWTDELTGAEWRSIIKKMEAADHGPTA